MSVSPLELAAEFTTLGKLLTLAARDDLPTLFSIDCTPLYSRQERNRLHVKALMNYPDGDSSEEAEINGIRAWAQAIGGVVLLGDPKPVVDGSQTIRSLSAIYRDPSGSIFEV
jgi:hypothetical protein